MTRPKKDEALTKTKDVHLRMNETEYEIPFHSYAGEHL